MYVFSSFTAFLSGHWKGLEKVALEQKLLSAIKQRPPCDSTTLQEKEKDLVHYGFLF